MSGLVKKAQCTRLPSRFDGKKWYVAELHRALAQLTFAEQLAVHMRYWEHCTIMQIAQHWGVPWDVADRLVTRAEEKIRQVFIKDFLESLEAKRVARRRRQLSKPKGGQF